MPAFVISSNLAAILEEARAAFSTDTSYAIDIALSASDILDKKKSVDLPEEPLDCV